MGRPPGLRTSVGNGSGATEAISGRGVAGNVFWMITVGSIVFRVNDLELQARFWEAALDYVRGIDREDDFVKLQPRDGNGPNISLDRVRANVRIPPQIHLDLYTEDQPAEVARLVELGATEVHWDKLPPDADYVILADPEGNRFCVIDTSR